MTAPTASTRPPNPTAAGRFVGQAVLRKEDPRLLTGRGRYTDDVELPRMLHAHFVRSDLARAKITRLDVSAAPEFERVKSPPAMVRFELSTLMLVSTRVGLISKPVIRGAFSNA